MKQRPSIATVVLVGMAIAPAQATTINWVTAANADTDLGLSYSVTSGNIALTAYGLTVANSTTQPAAPGPGLYAKNDGTGETGLGMAVDPGNDHEISAQLDDGIQIDFSNAIQNAPTATVTMSIGSAQSGEGWALFGSNVLYTVAGPSNSQGALGEPLLSGSGNYANNTTTITLPDWGQYNYYALMATDPGGNDPLANIVLGTVTISSTLGGSMKPMIVKVAPTPEPGTLLMAGTALIGLGAALKKRQKKA